MRHTLRASRVIDTAVGLLTEDLSGVEDCMLGLYIDRFVGVFAMAQREIEDVGRITFLSASNASIERVRVCGVLLIERDIEAKEREMDEFQNRKNKNHCYQPHKRKHTHIQSDKIDIASNASCTSQTLISLAFSS